MGFYSPTVWDNLLNSDRAAWDSVKDEDVIEESRGTCDWYSEGLMEQAFYGLYDPLAELSPVPPEGLEAESVLLHRAMEMDEYLSLRDEVYSDRMASMLATAAFSKELLERLPEDVKKDMEENRQAAQEAKEAQEKDPSDPAAREAAERARQALETLKQSMGRNQAQIENAAATAMENTGKELRDGKKMLSNLGFSPEGGRLTRTDVENMRYLAELLRNNERLRRMIELIGTMERIVEDIAPEEFTGLGAPEGSALRFKTEWTSILLNKHQNPLHSTEGHIGFHAGWIWFTNFLKICSRPVTGKAG